MSQQPEQNQIDDWQSQWNATKNMYDAEIKFLQETFDNKSKELADMQANAQEWLATPMDERINLRLEVARVRQELAQVQEEKNLAKIQFIGVNPQAEHYVQF